MITVKSFLIHYPNDPSVGMNPSSYEIQGDFIFEDEEFLGNFKKDILEAFQWAEESKGYIYTDEELLKQETFYNETEPEKVQTNWLNIEHDFIAWDNATNSNASQRQILDWFKKKFIINSELYFKDSINPIRELKRQLDEKEPINQKLLEAIKALKEYLKFLGERYNAAILIATLHHCGESKEDIEKGKILREKIKQYNEDIQQAEHLSPEPINQKLLDALKVCFASLCTYGSHPIIEKQVNEAIQQAK
ncbi:MAG: hypothetical protein PHW73_00575 [Atribacterota bacterium]|nr:hypothetical protein [Atribacterota bacterium]